jgi:hypothetical protein
MRKGKLVWWGIVLGGLILIGMGKPAGGDCGCSK